jgi:chaperonin GroEL (HSP60 family)
VLFRSAAREKILHGATLLCDAVRVTLGPKSKSVLIQKTWGVPIICPVPGPDFRHLLERIREVWLPE